MEGFLCVFKKRFLKTDTSSSRNGGTFFISKPKLCYSNICRLFAFSQLIFQERNTKKYIVFLKRKEIVIQIHLTYGTISLYEEIPGVSIEVFYKELQKVRHKVGDDIYQILSRYEEKEIEKLYKFSQQFTLLKK